MSAKQRDGARVTLDRRAVRRLALARAGLLPKRWSGLPQRGAGAGLRARKAAYQVIARFGYLQLDSVSVTGARTHGLVLMSRLEGFEPRLAEELLHPGEPLFEFWGHEASWLSLDLYPTFGFRRQDFRVHPWWGDVLGENPKATDAILKRLEAEGPLRSASFAGSDHASWWGYREPKKLLAALWSAGDIAISRRQGFQRLFDLTERVIPESYRGRDLDREQAVESLVLKALDAHGWAKSGTLAATWRLSAAETGAALRRLESAGEIVPCDLLHNGRRTVGWILPRHLEDASKLRRMRPNQERGVLLSPFDPLLWDRPRCLELFDFEQRIEIYKPKHQRKYGYYCLPILAGERLIGRVDLKARKASGELDVLALHFEHEDPAAADRHAAQLALERQAMALGLRLTGVSTQ